VEANVLQVPLIRSGGGLRESQVSRLFVISFALSVPLISSIWWMNFFGVDSLSEPLFDSLPVL
jgi:hypothetical protein